MRKPRFSECAIVSLLGVLYLVAPASAGGYDVLEKGRVLRLLDELGITASGVYSGYDAGSEVITFDTGLAGANLIVGPSDDALRLSGGTRSSGVADPDGNVFVTGASVNAGSGYAGSVYFSAGVATGGAGGGYTYVSGGDATGATGGTAYLFGGNGTSGGNATIYAGAGSTTTAGDTYVDAGPGPGAADGTLYLGTTSGYNAAVNIGRSTITTTVAGVLTGGRTAYEVHGSDDTLALTESDSTHTNSGAATRTFTLATVTVAGVTFASVSLVSGQVLRLDPGANEKFIGIAGGWADGEYMELDQYEAVQIVSQADGDWVVTYVRGTPAEQTP